MTTPDSSKCVIVAISMLIYTFFAMSALKSSSVIYVGSRNMLNLTREEASWPATLGVMLSQLAGPAYGVMLKIFSERFCLVFGALLCSLPLMASAYAQDIWTLCIFVGVIQGFGTACSEVVPFVILMRHFQKYRGTVISAMYIITAVSGFLMPVLYENFRLLWGFRVTLFIMGAVNLGMLLGCIVVNRIPEQKPELPTALAQARESSQFVDMSTDSHFVRSILLTSSYQSHAGSFMNVASLRERKPLLKQVLCNRPLEEEKAGLLSITFMHITISRAATVFSLATFLLILLDYSIDRNLDAVQGVFVLTVFTIGDLLSRILSGSLIDLKLLSHASLMSISFFVQGAAYVQLIQVDAYAVILISAFLIGLTGGCRNILATMIVTEECEETMLAISLGIMNFMTGVTIFFQPMIIGYVRDSLGSYGPLLVAFVCCNFILSFTWLMKVLRDRAKLRK